MIDDRDMEVDMKLNNFKKGVQNTKARVLIAAKLMNQGSLAVVDRASNGCVVGMKHNMLEQRLLSNRSQHNVRIFRVYTQACQSVICR